MSKGRRPGYYEGPRFSQHLSNKLVLQRFSPEDVKEDIYMNYHEYVGTDIPIIPTRTHYVMLFTDVVFIGTEQDAKDFISEKEQ